MASECVVIECRYKLNSEQNTSEKSTVVQMKYRHFNAIDKLAQRQWQNLCTTPINITNFSNYINMRLPGDQRAQIARDFNSNSRHSEKNPFFPTRLGGWFEIGIDDMFLKWHRQTEDYPTPLCIGLVTYDMPASYIYRLDDPQYGLVAQCSTLGKSPYSYRAIQTMTNCGQYENFTIGGGHFGIEPMLDTSVDLMWLHEGYEELCSNIADYVLLYYKNHFATAPAVPVI